MIHNWYRHDGLPPFILRLLTSCHQKRAYTNYLLCHVTKSALIITICTWRQSPLHITSVSQVFVFLSKLFIGRVWLLDIVLFNVLCFYICFRFMASHRNEYFNGATDATDAHTIRPNYRVTIRITRYIYTANNGCSFTSVNGLVRAIPRSLGFSSFIRTMSAWVHCTELYFSRVSVVVVLYGHECM